MSRDIDWNETDRLVTELKKKLEQDEGEAAAALSEDVSEEAAAQQPPAKESAEPKPRTRQRRPRTADPAADQEGEGQEAAPEQVPSSKQKSGEAYSTRTTFSMKTDEPPEQPFTSQLESDPAELVTERTSAALARANRELKDEKSAEETVETLMRDLFGAENKEWFSKEAKSPAKKAKPSPSASPEAEPSTQQSLQASPEERDTPKASQESVATVFLDKPAEREGQQIELFSSFAVGKLRRQRGMRLNPTLKKATEEEKELKRSVESSEDDFRLLLDLDYEDELGKAIGFEKIRDYHEIDVNGQQVVKRRRLRSGEKREYETQGQDIALRKAYAKQKGGYIFNLALAVLVLLVLFLYERPQWMANVFHGPVDGSEYPVSYILIGIQLLVLAAAFSYRRLLEGFLRLLRFSPIDSSFCSVMLLVTFCYHVVLIFIPHAGYPVLYLSPAAGSLVLLSLVDLLDWYRESLAFQVVSSRRQKYALVPRVSVGGKLNNARERLLETEEAATIWYVRPIGFVRNYFANTEKRADHQRSLGSQLLLIVSIGIALGLYVLATGGTAEEMWQTVFVTFLLSIPATSLLVTALPMFLASCLRLKKRSAIIGEDPIYGCEGKTVMVLPDSEAFGGMQRERFELIEGCDASRVMVLVKALLEKVQSPLADSIDVEHEPIDITVTDIEEHGVAALAGEEKISLIFGSVEYLQKYGIRVQPRGNDLEDICRRLLCVAIDRQVSVLFLARYRLTEDMTHLLHELDAESVRVMIRTKDPGVHNDMLARLSADQREPVRVMKPAAREVDIRTERVDATVVALGSCAEAARAFVVCRAIRRAGSFGKLLQALSVVTGVVISALLALFGLFSYVSPFAVTVYMLSFCALHGAVSFFKLREREGE